MRYLIYPKLLDVAAVATLADVESALAQAPDTIVVEGEQDMGKIPTPLLVQLYNKIRPEKPITKFSDRATANKRMWPALDALADKPQNESTTAMATKKKKATAAKKTPKEKTNGARGRTSTFAGKLIYKTDTPTTRREGSIGRRSYDLIRNGMTFEQFREKGGRTKDLAWDIKAKSVKVQNA